MESSEMALGDTLEGAEEATDGYRSGDEDKPRGVRYGALGDGTSGLYCDAVGCGWVYRHHRAKVLNKAVDKHQTKKGHPWLGAVK